MNTPHPTTKSLLPPPVGSERQPPGRLTASRRFAVLPGRASFEVAIPRSGSGFFPQQMKEFTT